MNPGPQFFRDAAIAAANATPIASWCKPITRDWCERALGVKRNQGMFGFGDYVKPNHARVITFLWLELLAQEQPTLQPWHTYPIGTKAHAIDGGHWIRVKGGWRWAGKGGSTFPTPGADAYVVTLPGVSIRPV